METVWDHMCSDQVTTMCDNLYDNVQMLTNSVIVKCKVNWQHCNLQLLSGNID